MACAELEPALLGNATVAGSAYTDDMAATAGDAIGPVEAVVLALVQGVTEFLPVSSSAHLVLPAALLGWPDQGLAFDVAVHAGTLLAVLVYVRRDLAGLLASTARLATRRTWDDNVDLLVRLGVASVPIAVCGWLFADLVAVHLRGTAVVASATLVFGLALWWADRRVPGGPGSLTPSIGGALAIGLAQALALVPGASRAGVTITAALLLGLGRTAAVRFSLLLAIPAIAGATALLATEAAGGQAADRYLLGLGFAVAAAAAFATIAAMLALVERVGMAPFAIYRIVLALALFATMAATA